MGKIVVSENVTLDGGVADPTGEEGTPRGGWFGRADAADRAAFGAAALEEAVAADAFLMGRRTYGFLSSRWPARPGPLAERLNALPKYVVSTTLVEPAWNNTTVLAGEVVAAVTALREQLGGEIIVPASFELVRRLFDADLVDELRITVYPTVLGTASSVFGALSGSVPLRLLTSRTVGANLTCSTYAVARSVVTGRDAPG